MFSDKSRATKKNHEILQFLLILFIVSTIFSHVLFLPGLKYKLQLTEILFVVLFARVIFNYKIIVSRKALYLDISFLLLSFILLINYYFHPAKQVALEVAGSLYLTGVYFVLSTLFQSLGKEKTLQILTKSSQIGFWILIAGGYGGLLIYILTGYSRFVLEYPGYPYFGDVFRIRGFNFSPNLYISLLCFFTCLKYAFAKLKNIHIILVALLGVISLTKEALLLLAVLFAILIYKKYKKKLPGYILIVISGAMYLFLSFYVISFKTNSFSFNANISEVYEHNPVLKKGNLAVYPTTYNHLFISGWIMGKEHPLKGIGLGNFQAEIERHKQRNLYPDYFASFVAHDSYTGIAAQLGYAYYIFLLVLFYSIVKTIKHIYEPYRYPLVLLLLYMLFESMAIGSFHFRHYFVIFAIIAVLPLFSRAKNGT